MCLSVIADYFMLCFAFIAKMSDKRHMCHMHCCEKIKDHHLDDYNKGFNVTISICSHFPLSICLFGAMYSICLFLYTLSNPVDAKYPACISVHFVRAQKSTFAIYPACLTCFMHVALNWIFLAILKIYKKLHCLFPSVVCL